jgi:hypothetical protein
MAVLRPRRRVIALRLSDDEYALIKRACAMDRARSISDFAREAILEQITQHGRSGYRPAEEVAVRLRLQELDATLAEIKAFLEYRSRSNEDSRVTLQRASKPVITRE